MEIWVLFFYSVCYILFFLFVFFLLIFLNFYFFIYSGTFRKPLTISKLQEMNSYFREIEIWVFVFLFSLLTFLFFGCFSFFLLIFLIFFYLFLTFFGTLQENDLTFLVLYKNTNSNFSVTLQERTGFFGNTNTFEKWVFFIFSLLYYF